MAGYLHAILLVGFLEPEISDHLTHVKSKIGHQPISYLLRCNEMYLRAFTTLRTHWLIMWASPQMNELDVVNSESCFGNWSFH